jgi:transcriptional regulator with XRE-family HTH domain
MSRGFPNIVWVLLIYQIGGAYSIMDYEKCINSIQALAKKQGISMKFLCDQLGKRRSFLSEVRLGKDRIHDNEIEVIASILSTTPAYLRGEIDDPEPPAAEGDWVDEIKISLAMLAFS